MKTPLLLVLLLLSACPERHYTHPGMSYESFEKLCEITNDEIIDTHTFTNSSGTALTVTLPDIKGRRENGCVGTFVFISDKLDSISR